jgi:DNA-binding SARP family transcriptional activator
MELRLLGEVALLADGGETELGPAKQRCVLAALAVDAGRAVSADRLIDRVWADDPPLRVRETLSVYVSRLRRILASAGNTRIARRAGGYVLEIEASAVDLHRFRTLRDRAMSEVTADRHVQELLREALRLWRGEALAGLGGGWAAAERDRLHRERGWDTARIW